MVVAPAERCDREGEQAARGHVGDHGPGRSAPGRDRYLGRTDPPTSAWVARCGAARPSLTQTVATTVSGIPDETAPEDRQGAAPGLIAGVLGVRAHEVAPVRGLVGASFLLGLALVLFYGSANAIFLTRYDVTVLPWVYIVNAVVVIAVGLAYGAWSARVPVGRALVTLAIGMTVSVALLWLWATLSDDGIVAFVVAVWFRLLFIFAVLGLWEIASAIFDIRQAKRLFAAVALGLMLAFVVGGVATPVLSPLLGTVNLVGVAAVAFALYTVDFWRLLRRFGVGVVVDTSSVPPAGPVEIITDRYSRRMVWMKTITILLLYVTEYVFYEQAAATFVTEASLAGFLGLFMGGMTVAMVLVTALVSGRFISHFGIRAATLALPVAMLVVALAAGFYGTLVALDAVFFVLVSMALATDHVVGNAIGEPAGAVLFQPMAPQRRMRVRLAVDGWLGSAALVLSGLLLLAFAAAGPESVAPFLFLVAGIALVGVVVAIVQYRSYVDALRDVTTLAFAGDGRHDAPGLDRLGPGHLVDDLGTDAPGTVLATTGLIRALDRDPLGPVLPDLLAHDDPWAVDLGLDAAVASGDTSRAAAVERVLDRDGLPPGTVRHALAALAALDPAAATARTRRLLDGPHRDLALASALDDPGLRVEAVAGLHRLVDSDEVADHRDAALALGQSTARGPDIDPLLVTLLGDTETDVVHDALVAARGRVSTVTVGPVAERLAVAELRGPALRALATAGPEAVGATEGLLARLPEDDVADVVRDVLGPHLPAAELLGRALGPTAPSVVRRAGYEALARRADTPPVRDLLDADLSLIRDVAVSYRDLGEGAPVVGAALAEEFVLSRRSIYAALAVEYDARRVADIETLVRAGDDDERANAIEMLDVMLARDHRRSIIAVLEPVDLAEAGASLAGAAEPAPAEVCMTRLRHDPRLSAWTRRVAAHHLDHPLPPEGDHPMDPVIDRVLALRRVDIFSTLPYGTLVELAGLVRPRSAPAGEVLIDAGSPGYELFALTGGAVDVHGPSGTVSRLEAGTVFGELAVLDPAPRSARVVAATAVELVVVPRSTVLALADRRPVVMAEIARVLARRLRAAG